MSPLHHFPVRVIFGVLGVITPTLGVDVHPYTNSIKSELAFRMHFSQHIFVLKKNNSEC